jgi:hypothetical protein
MEHDRKCIGPLHCHFLSHRHWLQLSFPRFDLGCHMGAPRSLVLIIRMLPHGYLPLNNEVLVPP